MADRVGQQLGSYRLIRLLGRGGFAEVYLGEHLRLRRQAAVKVLSAQIGEEEAAQFAAEARTVARLTHPHIVRVFDFAVQAGTPFLVMDYAPGGTLRQRFKRNVSQDPLIILPYLRQAAKALQYAHEQRLIHRDVKPENMLLDQQAGLLLSDFGIAVALQTSRSAPTQEVVGTASYMAPEQIQAHPRPASDQYALAVTVYEWLSGERPFTGSMTEVMAKHLFTPPLSLGERAPDLAPAIEAVVLRALSKDPQARFAGVLEFAAAFEEACRPTRTSDAALHRAMPSPQLVPEETILPQEQTTHRTLRLPEADAAPMQTTPPGWMQASPAPTLVPSRSEMVSPPDGKRAALAADTPSPPPTVATTIQEANWLRQRSQPVTPLPGAQKEPRRGHLSRRTFLLGGAAGIVVLGGGVAALALSHPSAPKTSRSGTATQTLPASPTATPLTRGAQLYVYTGQPNALPIAWSPDSKRILSGSWQQGSVQSWGALDGSAPITYSRDLTAGINTVAWSPDGALVAAGTNDGMLYAWDAITGAQQQVLKVEPYPLPGNSGAVNTIEMIGWSPNGAYLAVGSIFNLLQVRDGRSLQVLSTFNHAPAGYVELGAQALSWSPDSRYLVVYCQGTSQAFIWDIASGQGRQLFTGQSNVLCGLAWSPNGTSIASCQALNNVTLWDAASGQQRWATPLAVSYPAVAWSPDSVYMAVVDQGHGYTALLESRTGNVVFTGFPYVEMPAWSPDGTLLAASSGSGVLVMKAQ